MFHARIKQPIAISSRQRGEGWYLLVWYNFNFIVSALIVREGIRYQKQSLLLDRIIRSRQFYPTIKWLEICIHGGMYTRHENITKHQLTHQQYRHQKVQGMGGINAPTYKE